jgi:hypothetical protein
MKNTKSYVREIAFHTLLCIISVVTTYNVKKIHVNDSLHTWITIREYTFFESIIENNLFFLKKELILIT